MLPRFFASSLLASPHAAAPRLTLRHAVLLVPRGAQRCLHGARCFARAASGATTLVVVESPSKAAAISKYLGPAYVVLASYGHVRCVALFFLHLASGADTLSQ